MLKTRLWAVSPDTLRFIMKLNTGDEGYEETLRTCTAISTDDMAHYGWIEIGTVSMEFHLDLGDHVIQSAVKTFDTMEEKLREKFNSDLAAILNAKQEFLALPSPKDAE